jgi:hypothetical protein
MGRIVPLVSYLDGERTEIGSALVSDDGSVKAFMADDVSSTILKNFSVAGAFSIAPIHPPRPKKKDDT